MNNNISMIKSIALFSVELLFTFTVFGFNIKLGSNVYNWFAGLFGGFMFFWIMYFDTKIDNKAAFKMAFMGPTLSVFLSPWICEIRGVSLDEKSAPVIYFFVAFFGLTIVKVLYGFSKRVEEELPQIVMNFIRKKFDTSSKKKTLNKDT